jgi:tetratricopeptide (TPR) repeat protein
MEKEAQADMFMAELYFQKDSFNLALDGDGQYLGFLDIADEYSSTKAGALANYYAGLAYLNTGDFENAIEYLGDFSSDDIVLSALALGCIGDAYMELADTDNALSYYEDAAEKNINEFTTPRYMLKQAMIHEANGDVADALALYKGIEADYKASREGNGIEKYIARAENAL